MLIEWAENPLATEVCLDGHDTEILRLKLIIEALEEQIVRAYVRADKGEWDKAKEALDFSWMDPGETKDARDKHLASLLQSCRSALDERHDGDCVCVACGCMKCYAEDLLGICTIPDMTHPVGSAIASAFRAKPDMTTMEACAWLEANPAKAQGFVASPELEARWRASQMDAIKWLRAYDERKKRRPVDEF